MKKANDKVFEYIDQNFDDEVELLRTFLNMESISLTSTHNFAVDACGEFLRQQIEDLGAEAKLVRFREGYPVVYGRLMSKNPDAKTMIFYSLYDVMPADEEEWKCDPFAGEILDAKEIGLPEDYGECIVARGSRNQKGPTIGFIKALEALLKVRGDIPVNILFVVEGEEEISSVHLSEFRNRYLDELKEADAVWYGNPAEDEEGVHHIYSGFKGLVSMELTVKGGEWGGPTERSLFPSEDNLVDSPAWHLIWAIASLKDMDGNVLVEGFYDDQRPPTQEEKEMLNKLKQSFNEEQMKKRLGVKKFKKGKSGKELLENYVLGPVFNIDGYESGYTGPYIKTNFPHKAVAKFDLRMVPDMDPKDIVKKVRKHLDKNGFSHVEMEINGVYNWSSVPVSSKVIKDAERAAEKHGRKSAIWPIYWACVPISVFTDPPLSLPAVSAGIGKMGRPHEANEFFTVEGLRDYTKYVVTFLDEFAKG